MKVLNELELKRKSEDELAELLRFYSDQYYNGDNSEISDKQFDLIRDLLTEINPENPALKEVGSSVKTSTWKKVYLPFQAGSLNKAMNLEEFDSWVKKTGYSGSFMVSAKMDGGSLIETYEIGERILSATRGDGAIGQDITSKFSTGVDFVRKHDRTCNVRGEVVISKKNFDEMFSPKGYKNARNTACSTIRSPEASMDGVDVLYYFMDGDFQTEADMWGFLQEANFPVAWHTMAHTVDDVHKLFQEFENGKRDEYDYEIDGLVVMINDRQVQKNLGVADGRPRFGIAIKFRPKMVETVIERVEWQLGDSSRFTPVAYVTPVSDGFATIKKINLHNIKFIKDKGIKLGSRIQVARSGDIIPYCYKVLED